MTARDELRVDLGKAVDEYGNHVFHTEELIEAALDAFSAEERTKALTQAAEWFDRYDTGVAALLRRMASDDTLMQASLNAYTTPKDPS